MCVCGNRVGCCCDSARWCGRRVGYCSDCVAGGGGVSVASDAAVTLLDGSTVASDAAVTLLDGVAVAPDAAVTPLDGVAVASDAAVPALRAAAVWRRVGCCYGAARLCGRRVGCCCDGLGIAFPFTHSAIASSADSGWPPAKQLSGHSAAIPVVESLSLEPNRTSTDLLFTCHHRTHLSSLPTARFVARPTSPRASCPRSRRSLSSRRRSLGFVRSCSLAKRPCDVGRLSSQDLPSHAPRRVTAELSPRASSGRPRPPPEPQAGRWRRRGRRRRPQRRRAADALAAP